MSTELNSAADKGRDPSARELGNDMTPSLDSSLRPKRKPAFIKGQKAARDSLAEHGQYGRNAEEVCPYRADHYNWERGNRKEFIAGFNYETSEIYCEQQKAKNTARS